MGRRLLTAVGLGLAISVLAAGTALAGSGGAGTVSTTEHFHNFALIPPEHDQNPCTGAFGTFSATATNAVEHVTTNANGSWETFTAEGTATFDADGSAPAITGHITVWDGENVNRQNGTATGIFNIHIDGVTMHEVAHMNVSASGTTFQFDKPTLTCH